MRVSLTLLVAAFFACGVAAGGRQQEAAAPPPDLSTLVRTHCVACHNDRLKTAGLSLQSLDLTNVPQDARVWEKVARKLRSGEMPPSTVRNRPDPQLAANVVNYLEGTLDRAAAAHPNPGPTLVHRLTIGQTKAVATPSPPGETTWRLGPWRLPEWGADWLRRREARRCL